MTSISFIFAVFVLLLTPGPTNTLMALASSRSGFRRVAKLLPAELSGYMTAILPASWLGGEVMSRSPELADLAKVAAATWVLFLAIRLWMEESNSSFDHGSITASIVYVTTLLNPKALLFGMVFLPVPSAPDFLFKLAAILVLASMAAMVWGVIGQLMRLGANPGESGRLSMLRRAASIWLIIISISILTGVVRS